ncbi:MAG: T9SS type A sorting domain-containing protein [Flavobacteriales bacterium]|nr:T9SS type A sorting domain-containing protein [Flavobacteriales bacterium]
MKLTTIIFLSLLLIGKLDAQTLAGPYAPPAGQSGTTAIHKDSTIIIDWAISTITERGWQNIADTSLGKTTAGNDTSATDKSGINGTVSLGDGGSATLTFSGKIFDGTGVDFVVFENSFDGLFLELAFVEVSSDGTNFYRFDAVSLTDTSIQVPSFGNLDATNLYNLAGKYVAQYGTPFDLNELAGTPGLDINNITHVKIIDVIGNVAEPYTKFDSQNNPINDPWPTAFPTGGFDLDAVGVINFTPTSVNELNDKIVLSFYPNPSSDKVYFNFKEEGDYSYNIITLSGKTIANGQLHQELDISNLEPGIYFIQVFFEDKFTTQKIIKQ